MGRLGWEILYRDLSHLTPQAAVCCSLITLFTKWSMSIYLVPGPVLGYQNEQETTDWWEMDRQINI